MSGRKRKSTLLDFFSPAAKKSQATTPSVCLSFTVSTCVGTSLKCCLQPSLMVQGGIFGHLDDVKHQCRGPPEPPYTPPLSRSAFAPARVGLYPKPYGTCTTCTCISQCHVCSGHTVWVLYNIDAWFSCSMSMAGSTAWLYCSTLVIALGGSHAYPNFTALYCCAVLLLLCFVWDQPYM